jgi:hypothetical protein
MKKHLTMSLLLGTLLSFRVFAYDPYDAYWALNLPYFSDITYWTGDNNNFADDPGNWTNGVPYEYNYAIIPVQEDDSNYPVFYQSGAIGYLHIQQGAKVFVAGSLQVLSGLVLESDYNQIGSLILSQQSGAIATDVFTTSRIILRRDFQSNEWTFFSVPAVVNEFNMWTKAVFEYFSPLWGDLNTPDVQHTMYAARYNGIKRFETGAANASSGLNWEQLEPVLVETPGGPVLTRQFLPNEGYIVLNPNIDQATTTLFVIDDQNAINELIAANYTTNYTQVSYWNSSAELSNPNANWNLKGAPFFGQYNLAYSYQQEGQPMFFYQFDQVSGTYNVLSNTVDTRVSPAAPLFYQSSAGALIREARSLYCSLNNAQCGAAGIRVHPDQQDAHEFSISLQLSGCNKSDITQLRFSQEASTGFTINEDAVKLMSHIQEVPQLWSVSNGVSMAYNHLPLDEIQGVKLGIRVEASKGSQINASGRQSSASYSLKLMNREQFARLKAVRLTDAFTGASCNLLEDEYSFIAETNLYTDSRFAISFEHQLLTNVQTIRSDGFQLVTDRRCFYLIGLHQPVALQVYDTSGRLLLRCREVCNQQPVYLNPGVYLVKTENSTLKLVIGE